MTLSATINTARTNIDNIATLTNIMLSCVKQNTKR